MASQSSSYLLQHQHQSVAWQRWHPSVFSTAEQQDKPILLSIGYSTCHWCHVMSRESFSDDETAELMNQYFVNIKVDREERPDIDEVYQTAYQLLNGSAGGWPLTLFLCPKTRIPFLAGTYYPHQGEEGQLGFGEVLQRVNDFYQDRHEEFKRLRNQVEESFLQLMKPLPELEVAIEPVDIVNNARLALVQQQDDHSGGFGLSPKFAMPVNLKFLLEQHANGGLPEGQFNHLVNTLNTMAARGIHDQIDGGFFRYSTDANWDIPHFEKMLYDNGQLLEVYARAAILMNSDSSQQVALSIVHWLRGNMLGSEGGFYTAVDAEVNGKEGGSYCFSADTLKQTLSTEEFELFECLFGLQGQPNVQDQWHLSAQMDMGSAGSQLQLTEAELEQRFSSASHKLQELRRNDVFPHIDQKILVGPNAQVIKGLAILARRVPASDSLALAQGAMDLIRNKLWIHNRLFSAWQDGKPARHAYLDDIAYLMDALLELLQTQWRDEDYRMLISLAETLLQMHSDTEAGGLFFTAHDAEALIYRSKPYMDGVVPSANGVAARVMLRLGHLAAEPRYLACADSILQAAASVIAHSPDTHLSLVMALKEQKNPVVQVLMVGGGQMTDWESDIRRSFVGRISCYRIPEGAVVSPPESMVLDPGEAVICVGEHCHPVQSTQPGLTAQIREFLAVAG